MIMNELIEEYFEFKYGLIALDKRQINDDELDILHFCGYENEPDKVEADLLFEELTTDESFGLTEIAEYLIILPAPDETVEEYRKHYNENRAKFLN